MPTGEAKKEIIALAARARRIGWEVETAGRGEEWMYRITRPDGFRVQLHRSPSGVNWITGALRQLNDGQKKLFDKAEEAYKAKAERQRKQKLAADKAANDKALADAAKVAKAHTAAVNRAAGPHAVVEFDPGWLLTPHELPEIRRGILTPELAAKLLDTIDRSKENAHQRKYRSSRERDFTDIIGDGDWAVTHQGMAVDSLGRLQDGQHRAGAIHATGQPQEVYITVGMPPDNYAKLDSPLMRTAKDVLDIRGEVQTSALSSAIRLIMAFDRDGSDLGVNRSKHKITATAVDRFIAGPEGPHIRDAVHRCMEIRKEIKIMASALTAAIYLIGRAAGSDSPRVVRFFEDLETGLHIGERADPVYKLRKLLLDNDWGRAGQHITLALIIKTWNARAVGRKPGYLAWRRDEAFPSTIIVPAPEVD